MIAVVLIAGCKADNSLKKEIEALKVEVNQLKARRVDLSPVFQEIQNLKKAEAFTGVRINVSAKKGTCPPCDMVVRDFKKLEENSNWKRGVHFEVVHLPNPDRPVPYFEYVVDGVVKETTEGYLPIPTEMNNVWYEGNIRAVLIKHPRAKVETDVDQKATQLLSSQSTFSNSVFATTTSPYASGTYGTYGDADGNGIQDRLVTAPVVRRGLLGIPYIGRQTFIAY